jgi:superoxide dismutase
VVVSPTLSQSIGSYLIFRNSSGHINHSLFWKNLAGAASESKGCGGVLKPGPLKDAIDQTFGGFDKFKKEFNAATLGIQGSGWGWLVCAIHKEQLLLV